MTSTNTRVEDLYNRALSLGYDNEAAARVADCFDVAVWQDPCKLHKGHSTTVTHHGYLADGCEACKVIELSNAAGYTLAGWEATQARRAAEAEALMAAEAAAEAAEVADPAYAAWVAEVAKDASVEIIGGHPYGRKSGLPIFRNVADNSPGIIARHRAAVLDRVAEAERAEAAKNAVIKAHKLSAPMIGVLTEVAKSRGMVGAWAMRNVIVPSVPRATMRTVAALRSRGFLDAVTNEGNQSGTGGLTDYAISDRGAEVAEILGTPVVGLPTEIEDIAAMVASYSEESCETGCGQIVDRGVAVLAVGGDVCFGCGSIFTRPAGQEHPSLYVISEAVSARNASKGN